MTNTNEQIKNLFNGLKNKSPGKICPYETNIFFVTASKH